MKNKDQTSLNIETIKLLPSKYLELKRRKREKKLAKNDLNNTELAEFHNEFLTMLNKEQPEVLYFTCKIRVLKYLVNDSPWKHFLVLTHPRPHQT